MEKDTNPCPYPVWDANTCVAVPAPDPTYDGPVLPLYENHAFTARPDDCTEVRDYLLAHLPTVTEGPALSKCIPHCMHVRPTSATSTGVLFFAHSRMNRIVEVFHVSLRNDYYPTPRRGKLLVPTLKLSVLQTAEVTDALFPEALYTFQIHFYAC